MTRPDDVLARLEARGRLGVRLGLGRTRALLATLGSPEAAMRGALVGGTNGKGSTQALVAAVLLRGGHHVGQAPKPHLSSYRERIVVDGRLITEEDLREVLEAAFAAADRVEGRHGPATEFELLTAAAFLWLARQRVEVAVIEVGLGGRLDATNAWDGGVAAITNVGLDHMELLGDTVAAIAREKAAIVKRGDRAVTGAEGEALAVIRRRAARLRVPLAVTEPLPVVSLDLSGTLVRHARLGELRVGLLGRHQAANTAVSLAVIEALGAAGIVRVDDDAIRRGLAGARWPGRLEPLDHEGVTVLIDGAHNPDGAAALATAVDDLAGSLPRGRAWLLLGVLADKDVAGMLRALVRSVVLCGARVLATAVPGTTRTLGADELASAWGRAVTEAAPDAAPGPSATRGPATAVDDVDAALVQALAGAGRDGGPLIVAGSLYLVGHVRERLQGAVASHA